MPACAPARAVTTVCISILSEFITDAIIGASKSTGIPMPFLCTIVLPIVGNAAEHASALIFAYRNRMEIALGVALGERHERSKRDVRPICEWLRHAWICAGGGDLGWTGRLQLAAMPPPHCCFAPIAPMMG